MNLLVLYGHMDLFAISVLRGGVTPSLLVGFTSLQLMCGSVEGMVFSWLRGAYGTSSSSTILVMT